MNKIITAAVILFMWQSSFAQTFLKSVGTPTDDLVSSILQTPDNGYLLTGATKNTVAGFIDAMVMKMDSAGNILWTKAYGRGDFDQLTSAVKTFDGNYVCAGSASDSSIYGRDILLMKIDDSGDILWSKRYGTTGTDYASTLDGLIQLPDSGFVVAGISNNLTGVFNNDPFIMRLNKDGDTLWTRGLSNQFNELFSSVKQTPDGGFIVTGRSNSFGNFVMDALLVKFDANGNVQWQKRYGGNDWEEAQAVSVVSDGYVIAGATTTFGAGDYDAMVFKTDTLGNLVWSTAIGGVGPDAMYGIIQTPDTGFVITGFSESYNAHRNNAPNAVMGTDSAEVFAFKLNALGDTAWCYGYGGNLMDESYAINQTSDGRIMIAAQAYSFGDSLQGLIIITDENGVVGCNSQRITPTVSACPLAVDSTQFTVYSGFYTDSIALVSGAINLSDSTLCYLFTSAVDQQLAGQEISVSPNPATDHINVKRHSKETMRLTVYNILGEKMLETDVVSSDTRINCSGWQSGVYFLRLWNRDFNSISKIIKADR